MKETHVHASSRAVPAGDDRSAAPVRLAVVEPRLRLALTPTEAADALGVSLDYFNDHVRPELRLVRRGRKVLVPIRSLEAWLERSAALTLERGR